ncbi:YhfZ family protein [Microbacterium sp. J1-1]|uniref:YhfZ family protein n=1 Tax=Microbacterium sp. J1-1 TaxID=2992441 RepID=UPI002114A4F0|nr:YhfZ family protein [Microbacterium sp. J1-1]UUE22504.1 hypothetical protein LRQ07_18445 [Microbacterium sp. J1-1]
MRASEGIAGLGQGLHSAVRAIVLEALSRGAGATLPTNAHFKSTCNIAAGTMQRALDLLQDRGALAVVSRGHLGRVIESLDVGQCWQAAGLPPVRLLLPPRGPIEIDVLDNRLAEDLTRLGIPHTVHHRPGGARRVDAVMTGEHDLAVVSAGAFDGTINASVGAEGGARSVLSRRLEPGTYYAEGRLVVVRMGSFEPTGPLRIAIDRGSPDHVVLTEAEFPIGAGHTYIGTPFPSVPAQVLRGEVDVGIWHMTRTIIPLDLAGLATDALSTDAAKAAWGELSGAVLIGSPSRPELRSVTAELRLDDLAEVQQDALRRDVDDSFDPAGG